jgi:diacylglycerol kinase (ATP)
VQPRVDIIVNRLASKLGRETPVLSALHSAASEAPGRAFLHETRSLADLDATVRAIALGRSECVVLAGGDGSYMAGTTALRRAFGETLPCIAFAPGGTVCTVARNWGLRGDEATYAGALVRGALAGTMTRTPRPTLRVRDDHAGDRVGFIFGAGLIARFFDAYYEAPTQGYASAASLVGRIFVGTFTGGALASRVLTPSACGVIVDGERQAPPGWSLIAASVVRDLGLHMRLLYRAGEETDAFHVVASALPPRRLSPQVGRVLLGRRLRGAGHVDTLARELTVELAGADGASGAKGVSTYVLDGDRIAAGSVTVTAGPVLAYGSVG